MYIYIYTHTCFSDLATSRRDDLFATPEAMIQTLGEHVRDQYANVATDDRRVRYRTISGSH